MVSRAFTVAFQGVEAREVEVQCAMTPGMPAFSMACLKKKPFYCYGGNLSGNFNLFQMG
ncbi:hypothetical protein [Tateyamaria pelophila]|uniref:hypothetical protein n=1 Tax=Tateyamaria pelophila TaxID=328415 RepID=UPI001CBEC52C|nr:hypothetical protein [Tateyamaria pelophila]